MTEPTWRWPYDRISLVVWAAAGQDLEPQPELAIDLARTRKQDAEVVAMGYGLDDWTIESLTASAWAGVARLATERRDDAARALHARGDSTRAVGRAIGLSHAAVGRILHR